MQNIVKYNQRCRQNSNRGVRLENVEGDLSILNQNKLATEDVRFS